MRKSILAGLFLLFSSSGLLLAQNKTLGVGVSAPNSNAALHVESPTGNQGFIMPRLTSAQREAMTSLLTAADKGLMLYDTDLSTIYIWDGVSWGSASEFSVDNPASVDDAIEALTVGSGSAGRFTINNAASFSHGVYAQTNGDSTSAAVHGNHIGEGFGVFGKSAGSKFASSAVYGEHVGTGDAAGAFRISNPSNTYSALYGETNGSGAAVFGNQIGLGRGGQFQITNTANTQAAIRGYTAGIGNAGFYTINNAANDSSAIYSTTNGTGPAIAGLTTGTGPAAAFRTANTASTAEALFVESYGAGRAATFRKTATSGGSPAIYVDTQGGHGVWADHNGANGYAAIIQTINTANPNSAMFVESIGTGPSMWIQKSTSAVSGDALVAENNIATGGAANFKVTDATNTFPALNAMTAGPGTAIRAENSGAGNGFAGNFEVTNATNQYPAIQASSAGAGSAVRVMQPAGTGPGMDIFMQNTTSSAPGIAVDQGGLGHAGSFIVNNPGSGSPSLQAITNGGGTALEAATSTGFTALHARHDGAINGNAALIEITNTANTFPALQVNTAGDGFAINAQHKGKVGDAIYAEHAGAGSGSAGNFRISNTVNSASAVYASTVAPGGNAMSVSNDADGIAFTIWRGGLQVTVMDVTTATIPQRASAYRLVGGGTTFSLGYGPVDGEVFMIYNETGQTVTFSASGINHSILNGEGRTFIVFAGGAVRGF